MHCGRDHPLTHLFMATAVVVVLVLVVVCSHPQLDSAVSIDSLLTLHQDRDRSRLLHSHVTLQELLDAPLLVLAGVALVVPPLPLPHLSRPVVSVVVSMLHRVSSPSTSC